MTTGAIRDFNVTPDGDVVIDYAITDAGGSAKDLTNVSINIKMRDSDTSEYVLATYPQTIVSAVGGTFTFKIPKTLFVDRPGGEVYYQLILSENGNDVTYQSGHLYVAEVQ